MINQLNDHHAFHVIADMISRRVDSRNYEKVNFSQGRPPSVRRRVALVRAWRHQRGVESLQAHHGRQLDTYTESTSVEQLKVRVCKMDAVL